MLFQIGAVFIISSSAGADVFPLVVGQLLETRPETLLQLTAATVTACIAVFAVTAGVTARLERGARTKLEAQIQT